MTPTPRKRVIDRLSADVESQLKAIEDGDKAAAAAIQKRSEPRAENHP